MKGRLPNANQNESGLGPDSRIHVKEQPNITSSKKVKELCTAGDVLLHLTSLTPRKEKLDSRIVDGKRYTTTVFTFSLKVYLGTTSTCFADDEMESTFPTSGQRSMTPSKKVVAEEGTPNVGRVGDNIQTAAARSVRKQIEAAATKLHNDSRQDNLYYMAFNQGHVLRLIHYLPTQQSKLSKFLETGELLGGNIFTAPYSLNVNGPITRGKYATLQGVIGPIPNHQKNGSGGAGDAYTAEEIDQVCISYC